MKKGKNKGLLQAALYMVCLMLLASGCGKKDEGTKEEKGYSYIAEYAQMDLKCDHVAQTAVVNDILYMAGSSWNEENGISTNYFYKYDMADGILELLPLDISENSYINGMAAMEDGNLAIIVNNSTYDLDENGEPVNWQDSMEMWKISGEDGAMLDSIPMDGILGDENTYINSMCIDGQGNYYLYNGDSTIFVLNSQLEKLCEIKSDNWINQMVSSKEGDVYVTSYGETGMELRKIDTAAKSLGEKVEGISDGYGDKQFFTGLSKSFLIGKSGKMSYFDLSTETEEELFDWLDVDVNSDYLSMAGELSDGRIFAVINDNSEENSKTDLVFAKKVKASEVAEKEEITYGAMWVDYNLKKNIISFNKTNDKYRIVVKEYGTDDYQTGLTQFNADLTTGKCPDIIDLSSVNYSQYANMGILEDLYPYMEKSGLKKEDYLENVLGAFEVEGKLCGITPQFYVTTAMAKASIVGNVDGWTLSEMLDFVEKQNPDNVFAYGNRSQIFYYCIYNNIDEFIDWETGKCNFDGEDFIRTLEFAAKFPEEPDYDEEEGLSAKLRSDKILLMQGSVSSVQEYQMMNGLFGEPIAYVGFPNNERKGNLIQTTGGFMGISAKSKNKEGAWEFVKSILSEEYQDSLIQQSGGWGFPVKKSSLEKQFDLDMTQEFYEDENGNQIEQTKTTWGYDDFQMEIYAATKEEVEAVRELLMSAQKLSGSVNEQMVNIITEETEAFFSGQKSAADTAAVIQNRIQIYVNENR